ncbi:hypothetical protein [Streptomyces sp. 3212.3]|uniref:hypothetical protein n=1 Tax=Streptomyces sp. 3212.3 TaxID=1938846 RepID=UPI0015F2755E|nr:hypothetical protein [Streptomyces sp. 3212.3]
MTRAGDALGTPLMAHRGCLMAETAIPEMVRQRDEEEGIGDGPTARARTTRMYLKPVAATPGLQIGLHDTIFYNSIHRFDDNVSVNPHVLGAHSQRARPDAWRASTTAMTRTPRRRTASSPR